MVQQSSDGIHWEPATPLPGSWWTRTHVWERKIGSWTFRLTLFPKGRRSSPSGKTADRAARAMDAGIAEMRRMSGVVRDRMR